MVSLCEVIYDHALTMPGKIAVSDEQAEYTYAQLWAAISGFGAYLHSLGAVSGSCVLVQATNTAEFVAAYYGVQYAGCIAVPVDKQVPADSVRTTQQATGAKFIVSAKGVDADCQLINASEIWTLTAPFAGAELPMPRPDQPADLIFTTGTTGKAKGVLTSHGAIAQVAENQLLTSEAESDTVYMVYGPVSHVNALRKMDAAMYGGFTLVMFDGMIRTKKFFQTMTEKRVTATHLLPSAARMLLTLSKDRLGEYKDQLKYIDSGASAYPDSDREKIMSLLPNTRLYFAYGLSEVFCVGKYEFSKYPGKTNCIGRQMPHSRCFIVDDDRSPKPSATRDDPGFIAFESTTHMIGYWNEPELTAGVLVGDTVYTNDLGYIDDDGFIYVLGRRGDVINVGGVKVSAQELETLAVSYPGVVYAGCIPVEDKLNGQVPRLYIQMEQGAEYNAADFKAFLASSMENYKLPRSVQVLEQMPMKGVKVDKQALIRLAKGESA